MIDHGQNTAMMEAAEKGHDKVVVLLLGAGAEAPPDWTPLMIEIIQNNMVSDTSC